MSQHLQFPHPDQYQNEQFQNGQYPPNMGDISPRSPDLISMSGLGLPPQASMQGFAHYASPSQGLGVRQAIDRIGAFASVHDHQGLGQNQGPQPTMMVQFIEDNNAPWNSLRMNAAHMCGNAASTQPAIIPPSQPSFNFGTYRAYPPSEADTLSQSVAGIPPSDSGYGSLTRQSVGNRSVCGGELDQSAETQSLIFQLQGLSGTILPQEESRKREGRGQKSGLGSANPGGIICPECQATVKTPSELKKHESRHKKPHKCDIPGCPKAIEGFSTNNDLERHKKCVHKVRKPDEIVYRCNLESCGDKLKDWPRQDNFRQHLKRKHGLMENVDLAPFIYRDARLQNTAFLGESQAVAPDVAAVARSGEASPLSWAATDPPQTASPASLMNGNHAFVPTAHLSQFSGNHRAESDAISLQGTNESPYPSQNQPDTADYDLVGLTYSGPSIPTGLPQGPSTSAAEPLPEVAEPLPEVAEPACIPPDVLSQTGLDLRILDAMSTEVQSRVMIDLVVDEDPEAPEEDAQSDRDGAESTVPKEMDVDDPVLDTASDDDTHEPDSETDEPSDSPTNAQLTLPEGPSVQCTSPDQLQLKLTLPEVPLAADSPKPIDLDKVDETQASALIKALKDRGMLDKLLKEIGHPTVEKTEAKAPTQPVISSAASDSGRLNKCHECPKSFQRPCELKKHQKRHLKPYSCTFPKCDKKFGSKNDWKRHENSQHFQLEIWRCAEKIPVPPPSSPPTTSTTPNNPTSSSSQPPQEQQPPISQETECGRVCHRRESLRSHLERDHGIADLTLLDRKLAECRMGRNFESRFWCGFCQKTIEPTGKSGPAHSERFDHIDDHFNGRAGWRKADISEWKHVDFEGDFGDGENGVDKMVKGGRGFKEWGSRKRAVEEEDGEGDERVKRRRGHGEEVYWTCCACANYWAITMTDKCMGMEGNCGHNYCDGCRIYEHENTTEKEVEIAVGVGNRGS
ncbi:hypothetical protein VTI74DRAFT_7173 [Chaetomium olivicolor]